MPDAPPTPAAPDPQVAANRQQLMDRLTTARQQGATWDQIHESLATRVQSARQAGATDAQIQHSLGFNNPEELIAATQSNVQQHMAATKPTSWAESFVSGLTHSSAAALLGIKPDDTPVEGHGARISEGLGEAVGDFPASVAGAVGGAFTGTLAGGPVGGYVAGAGGATALPQLIKSERDRYVKALQSGQVRTPEDFLHIQGQVMADTAEAGAVGIAAGGAGGVAGPLLDKMGAGRVTKFLGTVATESATMATAQATLAGHMPKMEDFVDAAVTVGAFHTAHAVAAPAARAIRTRLMQNYAETGETPQDSAARAVHDPIFRAQMMGVPHPEVPVGSSRSDVAPPPIIRPGTMANEHTPLPQGQFVIPRAIGGFDEALPWVLKEEGGLTKDTGGVTKWGISAKAHPGLDIANLSQQEAGEIYHKEYWRAIDADALDPKLRLAAFDSAVNEGVGQTKTWLREAGGDVQAFMRLRIEKYAKLARDPKYAPYAKSWARRLKDLGATGDMAGVIERGPENVGREFTPEDRAALDLDGGEGGKPPEDSGKGGKPPEDEDPWQHVMSRVAPDEGTNWFGNSVDAFKRIYGELFDPMHPVRRLVDSVTKGDALDDYSNPNLLFRVAENSGEVAKVAISRNMVDLDGNTTGHGLEDIVSGKSSGTEFSKADQAKFLNGYAIAKWALMMDAQGKQSGVDTTHAAAVVAQGDAQFGAAFQHLVDWRNGTLKWLGEAGVHDSKKIDALIAENDSTIPGYRRMDDGSYQPVSTGKPGIWNPIKGAKGSERLIEPILKSLMQDAFLRHELASNNRAMVALADLGIKGNEATEHRAVDVNIVAAMDEMKKQGVDEDMLSSLAKSAGAMLPKDEVPIFRDGKMYGVKFTDPELTRVLRGYDQNARRVVMKVIGTITSIPRNLQTRFNPLFPVHLLSYDLPWQYITNPDSKGPVSSFLVGLGHMTNDAEGYQRWLQSGGADHIFDGLSKSDYIRRVMQGQEEQSLASNMWNVAKSPFDALTGWTRMVSTPIKFGRYLRGVEQGETPLRAAAASSEAAFHRPAFGGPVGKAWNTLVPYTTAHLNGLDKSVRAQFGLGSTITGAKYNALHTTIKAASTITLMTVASWFAYKDEEWYKAMPEWQKNNAWIIVPPIGGAPPIPIAAPPILSTIYVALPRMLLEAFIADNPHAADDIWSTLGASLMPPGGLTGASILTPILEHISNHSFHQDRPLVNQNTIAGVQPAEQFTQYSSPAARDLAQYTSDLPLVHSNLGWSPPVIDNYISQWGGPMGRVAAAGVDKALAGSPSNPYPETKVSEWPGVSSWAVRYPSASAAPIQQFYDAAAGLAKENGSLLKELRDGNFSAFKRVVDQGGASAAAYHQLNLGENIPPGVDAGPYMDYLAQKAQGADYQDVQLVHQAATALQNAHKWAVENVNENHNLTGHDKRQILDSVNAQMQAISERGNEAADRALIGTKRAGAAAHAPAPDSIEFTPPELPGQ